MKTYSTGTSTADRIRSKWFGSSRSLFGDSTFVTVLTIALIVGLIPTSASTNVESTYHGILSSSSPRFTRLGHNTGYYYYKAIEVTISVNGTYNFTSSSSIDTCGYLYTGSFNSSYPSQNLITSDDDSGGNRQFHISHGLQSGHTYILVITTFATLETGNFLIRMAGPESISPIPITARTSEWPTTATYTTSTGSVASSTISWYPLPAITVTLSSDSPIFIRPYNNIPGQYYYQAIRVTVFATGTYIFASSSSIDTYGCLYDDSFDPFYPFQNLITTNDNSAGSGQLQISYILQPRRIYILVVTTYSNDVLGSVSIRQAGPTAASMRLLPQTTGTISGILSSSSSRFVRPNGNTGSQYYYQAIQVTVSVTGTYVFKSDSSMDTYGCLYNDPFNPSSPSLRLIECDDDGAGNRQFQINRTLQFGYTYILVVTTYRESVTGNFSIRGDGPASVTMTLLSPTRTLSGNLSSNSEKFSRPHGNTRSQYYYQAIQVTVSASGTYTFKSNSSVDTYGCLYYDPFDPSSPSHNLITYDDDSAGNQQFQINPSLQFGSTYVLVVTTCRESVTGSFLIRGDGSGSISMTALTPTAASLSGILSSSSQRFSRPNGKTGHNYYYQAIKVTIYTTGTYIFKSSSSIDTYGCLYRDTFDPSYPSNGLMISNDDDGGNQQFQISINLQSGSTYILVVTTYSAGVTGSFSISASGPTSVNLIKITAIASSSSSNTLIIAGITFGCILLFLDIVGICANRQKRKVTPNQIPTSSRRNRNARVHDVPMDRIHGNAATGIHLPYTISMPTKPIVFQEELPPSYDAYMSSLPPQEQENHNRY